MKKMERKCKMCQRTYTGRTLNDLAKYFYWDRKKDKKLRTQCKECVKEIRKASKKDEFIESIVSEKEIVYKLPEQYIPIMQNPESIVVFTKQQLEDALANLERAGAQAIGVPVKKEQIKW